MEEKYYKNFWEELIAFFPMIRHGPNRKLKNLEIHRHPESMEIA
jgi:hypothetical protein